MACFKNTIVTATDKKIFTFRKTYFEEKISSEVAQQAKQQKHREVLKKATERFREEMARLMPTVKVFATGSYACGVDIHSSDLDFTLKFKNEEAVEPIENLAALRNVIRDESRFHQTLKLIRSSNVSLLKIKDVKLNVEIDITAGNDTAKRNTAILNWYGQVDGRFPVLCQAVKDWAAHSGVENSKEGRINSFSLCLMLIHFLQVGVTPAVFPCLQEELPELNGEIEIPNDDYESWKIKEKLELKGVKLGQNKSSLAELFVGFINYFSEFDFKNKWISVRRGKAMEKKDAENNKMEECPNVSGFITVEDPFQTVPYNCAGTLRHDVVLERFQREFKKFAKEIYQFGTIYIGRPSPFGRLITDEGKKRDLQKYLEGTPARENSMREWIVPVTYELFSGQHPKEFWQTVDDDKKNEGIVMPQRGDAQEEWIIPERVAYEYYDL